MATKHLSGVWRTGTGGQIWYTGLSLADFQAKDSAQFAAGMRLVDLDTNGGFSAVWRPGTDAQFYRTAMSWQQFNDENITQVNGGLRIVSVRVSEGRYDVVWRSGTGIQYHLSKTKLADIWAADGQYFPAGSRLVTVQQDFDKGTFLGVWRSDLGTGAQWVKGGMDEVGFKAEDARQSAAGLRLLQITSLRGIAGLWRDGSPGGSWALQQPYDVFARLVQQHYDEGLRLTSLSVGYH